VSKDRLPIVRRIDHVGVAVRDITTSLRYYVDVLGMTLSDDVILSDGSARLAYLEAGDTTLQLVQPLLPGPVADHLAVLGEGLHHVCFTVDSLDAALHALPGDEPNDGIYIGGRQCRVSFIRARPNGLVVELTEMLPPAASERTDPAPASESTLGVASSRTRPA
jgi:methylmalonyl-CoA/ethylmalonyl-CoA epimerase